MYAIEEKIKNNNYLFNLYKNQDSLFAEEINKLTRKELIQFLLHSKVMCKIDIINLELFKSLTNNYNHLLNELLELHKWHQALDQTFFKYEKTFDDTIIGQKYLTNTYLKVLMNIEEKNKNFEFTLCFPSFQIAKNLGYNIKNGQIKYTIKPQGLQNFFNHLDSPKNYEVKNV